MYSGYTSHYYQPSPYQQYYAPPPQQPYYDSTPSPHHHRRATADGAYAPHATYTYYTIPPEDSGLPRRSSSHRHREHVSSGDGHKSHPKRYSYVYTTHASGPDPYRPSDHHRSSAYYAPPPGAAADDFDSAYERKYRTSPPPFAHHSFSYPSAYADCYTYPPQAHRHSEHKYEPRPRERRSSHAHHQHTNPQPQPQPRPQPHSNPQPQPRPRDPPAAPPVRPATEADARKAGIPAGFSLKYWDPDEEPILLLGSVFDATSLGKWIYDWTVHVYRPGHPLTDMAGDLWLLLIQLAGKIKRAEGKMRHIRHRDDREMIDDYLESGELLWQRISKMLKLGEKYMMKSAKRVSSGSGSGSKKKTTVHKDSGRLFVKCLFDRDHELERTEDIINRISLWNKRFDVNCEEILKDL